jgi:hypothetical protein
MATIRHVDISATDRRSGASFPESKVRASSMIVRAVAREDAPQMRLVENDHVIETLSPQRADQTLDVRILPGTRRGRDDFRDAHACQSPPKDVAVDVVPISM